MSLQGSAAANRIEELEGEVERLKEELAKFAECHPAHLSEGGDLECSWSFLEGTHHRRIVYHKERGWTPAPTGERGSKQG